LTSEQKRDHNLVLFGSPRSNPLIKRVIDAMGVQWDDRQLSILGQSWNGSESSFLGIYPSPFDANRYVVINSGFTFREYAYLNNARQIPMLPDWAVVDTASAPNSQTPGKILQAGFFDERWGFKAH
jgi:hypothetical protein